MTAVICIAGFGDDASMYRPLLNTELADRVKLVLLDLPGFGEPPRDGETTLESLADVVDAAARAANAEVVLAHSVASIIASLAAGKIGSPIRTIFSLEGNLTAEDAYFSGTAADYDYAESFRKAFLLRLEELARNQPEVDRYRAVVAKADPLALWQLGCDARRFSEQRSPGDTLIESATVAYFYNPANLPTVSLEWLKAHDVRCIQLDGASHWASVDQPHQLGEKLIAELVDLGHLH